MSSLAERAAALNLVKKEAHTCENSGWDGTDSVWSSTAPEGSWDPRAEVDGCGFEGASVSIGSSFPPARSSGGSEVSMGSSAPDKEN